MLEYPEEVPTHGEVDSDIPCFADVAVEISPLALFVIRGRDYENRNDSGGFPEVDVETKPLGKSRCSPRGSESTDRRIQRSSFSLPKQTT